MPFVKVSLRQLRSLFSAQVTVEYKKCESGAVVPNFLHTVVFSCQHKEEMHLDELRPIVIEQLIKPLVPKYMLTEKTEYLVNPCGTFHLGGPYADAGLTGRKIIVDTYGGWGAHGGGAFSGKDYSKVDRSAAYAARWIAKSLVKAGLCRRVLVQLSYAIGINDPVSVYVDTYRSGKVSNARLLQVIKRNFDLRPGAITKALNLNRPIYRATATFGHFGRPEFPWEVPKELVMEGSNGDS